MTWAKRLQSLTLPPECTNPRVRPAPSQACGRPGQPLHRPHHRPSKLNDPEQATATALTGLARRVTRLTEEITILDRQLAPLVGQAGPAPAPCSKSAPTSPPNCSPPPATTPTGCAPKQHWTTSAAAAPIPANSGRVRRHRLHRGGDRGANHALHTIALCRLRYDPRTRA